jgi:hypothetical protein
MGEGGMGRPVKELSDRVNKMREIGGQGAGATSCIFVSFMAAMRLRDQA